MTSVGMIVGNRGFFPDHLCESGRKAILEALEQAGIGAVIPPAEATKLGAIETAGEARLCADYFKEHREEIEGIVVTLPNFGDEKAVANTLRWAGLDVPVLVHAFDDTPGEMSIKTRRDSFCGKMSVCNNLRQYGIKYSLTRRHTIDPGEEAFIEDLRRFAAVCRVAGGVRGARLGQIGARPAAFNTVRFSEKLLERGGISVETLDLSELLGWAQGYREDDPKLKEKLEAIRSYTKTEGVPAASLEKMARLGVAIDGWVADNGLDATAIQCWTALEEFYGVVPCTLMSMMSNSLMSSACETDIAGVVGMHALSRASERPAALLDWNNNYGDDDNKGVVFHCSNLPRDLFHEHKMDYQAIIAGTVGKENTFGTITGRIEPGAFSYCRVSTDDLEGRIAAYCGEGRFTEDKLETFGGYGVIEVPQFQALLQMICRRGFEHHVAATRGEVGEALAEAMDVYLGWDVYHHRA